MRWAILVALLFLIGALVVLYIAMLLKIIWIYVTEGMTASFTRVLMMIMLILVILFLMSKAKELLQRSTRELSE